MKRAVATDFDQRVHALYDDYTHGRIDRREFARRAAALTVAELSWKRTLQFFEQHLR